MKANTRFKFTAAALGLFAAALCMPAVFLSAYAIIKARMPYNEEGNYFDGVTVHHAGSEYFYGLLALLFWLLAISAGMFAYRCFKRANAAQPGA